MITVTILTKNSQKHLEKVLSALVSFDEVLIGDTGSTDKTLEIASKFPNVRIERLPFLGFGKTHNDLVERAKNDWIFSLDSDEVATDLLVGEIHNLQLKEDEVYSITRKNYYRGIWIKTCGWYPDRVVRIYNRKRTHFSCHEVHEAVITTGLKKVELYYPLIHYPYEKVSDFLAKMQFYTDLYARQNGEKKATYFTAITHSAYTFFKCYFLKRGFMQGGVGFEISMYNAITAFYKYLKLI